MTQERGAVGYRSDAPAARVWSAEWYCTALAAPRLCPTLWQLLSRAWSSHGVPLTRLSRLSLSPRRRAGWSSRASPAARARRRSPYGARAPGTTAGARTFLRVFGAEFLRQFCQVPAKRLAVLMSKLLSKPPLLIICHCDSDGFKAFPSCLKRLRASRRLSSRIILLPDVQFRRARGLLGAR